MKQLFVFLLVSFTAYAQNFTKVDAKVLQYPNFSNVESLANQIKNDFSSDEDKARAAFFWLAQNIRYNLKELYNPRKRKYSFRYSSEEEKQQKLQAIKDKMVNDAIRNKLGVCEEYAQSFKKICDLLRIESEVIKGYVRNDVREISKIPHTTNHAWNAVKIDGKWIVLDATWAAGHEYNGKWIRKFNNYFFNIPKNKIFKTHYPDDKLWVLRFGRMSLEEFYNQPIYTNTFLNLETSLISPKEGIIYVTSSDQLSLQFKDLDSSLSIFYTLSGFKNGLKPNIVKKENTYHLEIINPKRDTDLILYINKNDALHFKIRMK